MWISHKRNNICSKTGIQQFIVHLLMSFSPTLNISSFIFRFFLFKAFIFLFVKKLLVKLMVAPLLHKKLPYTYPLDGKLPPPSKRCSSSPYSTFFGIYKVLTCWRGCLHYRKSTLNFAHSFNNLFFLQYWNISSITLYFSSPKFLIHLSKFISPPICYKILKYTISIFSLWIHCK